MPSTVASGGDIKFPNPNYLTLENFKRGVITLIDQSRTPRNALVQADNLFLVEDGQPAIRPGVGWFGTPMPNGKAIDGYDYYDFGGAIHLVAAAGGVIYRSTTDGATWDLCTGGTVTEGVEVNFNQNATFLYITTGVNDTLRYNGTTTLQTYVELATPAAPTIANTNLAGTQFTVYYKTSAVNKIGFSLASATASHQVRIGRESWDATNYVTLTLPAPQASQERADIYYSTDNLNFYYLDSIVTSTTNPQVTYRDDGRAIVVPSTVAPTGNTTKGPRVAELVNVGSRMYGVRDPNNRYRIWFTGTGTFAGAFSTAYDGGYLDWQPGGKYIPVKVEDYRDGKGTSLATIWCDSADGEGCILQMTLDTLTIQDISITIPSAYKLPGSRGTPSPGSVVNVLNDYFFYNSQAFYNLGSRAQFLNLLSTDEASANIRPTVKQISSAAEGKICSAYIDAKVLFSVPYGSTENNATVVYDTEQKAWLPNAFTIGFKRFLKYTDANRVHRLLAVKPGDNQLSEISAAFQGDYGVPFKTDLTTGLYPVNPKNRFDFQFTEEMQYEFSNPQGDINVELLGIERKRGFSSIKKKTLRADSVTTQDGWDSLPWDTVAWDSAGTIPTVLSESSVKRYNGVQKELNAIQWHISTNSLNARYIMRTLQSWGTDTQSGHPASWRVQ